METNESPNQRFTRLAVYRVNKALDCYRLLSNLKSSQYKSTLDQRTKVITALRRGLEELELTFAGEKPNKDAFVLETIDE